MRFPFDACHEVGVDCEDERRRTSGSADRLAKRWLSADEHAFLESVEDDETRASRFMRLWTLKEAYVKALGTGIAAHPFAQFDVSMTPNDANDKDEDEARERVELRERSTTPRERTRTRRRSKKKTRPSSPRGRQRPTRPTRPPPLRARDMTGRERVWVAFHADPRQARRGADLRRVRVGGSPGSEGNAEAKRFERRSADDAEGRRDVRPGERLRSVDGPSARGSGAGGQAAAGDRRGERPLRTE